MSLHNDAFHWLGLGFISLKGLKFCPKYNDMKKNLNKLIRMGIM